MIEITFLQNYIAPSCRERLCILVSFCNIFSAFSGWLGRVLEIAELQNGSESLNQKTAISFPYFFQITVCDTRVSAFPHYLCAAYFFSDSGLKHLQIGLCWLYDPWGHSAVPECSFSVSCFSCCLSGAEGATFPTMLLVF